MQAPRIDGEAVLFVMACQGKVKAGLEKRLDTFWSS